MKSIVIVLVLSIFSSSALALQCGHWLSLKKQVKENKGKNLSKVEDHIAASMAENELSNFEIVMTEKVRLVNLIKNDLSPISMKSLGKLCSKEENKTLQTRYVLLQEATSDRQKETLKGCQEKLEKLEAKFLGNVHEDAMFDNVKDIKKSEHYKGKAIHKGTQE